MYANFIPQFGGQTPQYVPVQPVPIQSVPVAQTTTNNRSYSSRTKNTSVRRGMRTRTIRPKNRKKITPITRVVNVSDGTVTEIVDKPSDGFDFNIVFTEIMNIITKVPIKTGALVIALCAFFIIMNSGPRYTTGIIGDLLNNSTSYLATWVRSHPNDFTGLLIFTPGLALVPYNSIPYYITACIAWVNIVPESTIIEYVVQALGLNILFQATTKHTRIAVLGAVLAAYLFGWLTFGLNTGVTLPINNQNISFNSYKR